jgi:hypothetical protein
MSSINTRKLCKQFIKKGDTQSFAELCTAYVPNASDEKNLTLMGAFKTMLTKRNKPARLQAALRARNTYTANEKQRRIGLATAESNQMLSEVQTLLNAAKEIYTQRRTEDMNLKTIQTGLELAEQAKEITTALVKNAQAKRNNTATSSFGKNVFKNLNALATGYSREAEMLSSEFERILGELTQLRQQKNTEAEEERIRANLDKQIREQELQNRKALRNLKQLLTRKNMRVLKIFNIPRVEQLTNIKNTNTQEEALNKTNIQGMYYELLYPKKYGPSVAEVTTSAAQGYVPTRVTLPGAVPSNRASRVAALKGRKTSEANLAGLPVPAQKSPVQQTANRRGTYTGWFPRFGGSKTRKNRKH